MTIDASRRPSPLSPVWSEAERVAALESYGIEVSENFVARVKAQMFGSETKAARERSKRPPKTKSCNRPQQRKIPSAR